jgi:Spy/CpxP family protein refolding chaperone
MNMKNSKAILSVLLVFVFGAASGALITHVIHQTRFESFARDGRQPREDILVKRLSGKLDLDSQQQEKVRTIIRETQLAMHQIRQQSRPQIEAVLAGGQQRISALLTPEQREKFEKIIAEHKLRRQGDDRKMPGREH